MGPEITPPPQKGHWTWDSTGYGRQTGGTHPSLNVFFLENKLSLGKPDALVIPTVVRCTTQG